MQMVLLTAVGVGGATVVGALLGFLFGNITHRMSDLITAFAAGVMLCASVVGLVLPSLEHGGAFAVPITVAGIFIGALCLNLADRITPHIHRMIGDDIEPHPDNAAGIDRVLLFVMAIAIHNLPEGIAAGVGFGTGDVAGAMTIAGGIALQNIPEGMVVIAPMLAAGISRRKTFVIALVTGLVEVAGTLIGYFAVSIATAILPFALAFAGGTMLYVISDEMIPETHHSEANGVTYSLLAGFSMMLILDYMLG